MAEEYPEPINLNHPRVREFLSHLTRIGEGEDDLLLPVSQDGDNLDTIAHALNTAIGKLKQDKFMALKAAAQKSRFLGSISHEIRTPVSAILNYSHFLEDDNIRSEDRQVYVQKIGRNCAYLISLIDSLLDLSKVEASITEKTVEAVSLKDELQSISEFCAFRANEKNIDFKLECCCDVAPLVELDKTKFRQVILNLANNALKFTRQGCVSIRCFHGPIGNIQDALGIEVQDSGIGIPIEDQDRIFDDFHRVNQRAKEGGIGLGLSIARATALSLGGDVQLVSSRLGQGSTFLFYLPVVWLGQLPKAPQAEKRVQRSGLPSGTRILLAEDSPDLADVFGLSFRKANAQVTFVENGLRALEALNTETYDVIVMDYEMPVVDGISAIKSLRARGIISPVIMLTAHTQVEKLGAGYAAGANLVLTKPILGSQLVKEVEAIVGACRNGCGAL